MIRGDACPSAVSGSGRQPGFDVAELRLALVVGSSAAARCHCLGTATFAVRSAVPRLQQMTVGGDLSGRPWTPSLCPNKPIVIPRSEHDKGFEVCCNLGKAD